MTFSQDVMIEVFGEGTLSLSNDERAKQIQTNK